MDMKGNNFCANHFENFCSHFDFADH